MSEGASSGSPARPGPQFERADGQFGPYLESFSGCHRTAAERLRAAKSGCVPDVTAPGLRARFDHESLHALPPARTERLRRELRRLERVLQRTASHVCTVDVRVRWSRDLVVGHRCQRPRRNRLAPELRSGPDTDDSLLRHRGSVTAPPNEFITPLQTRKREHHVHRPQDSADDRLPDQPPADRTRRSAPPGHRSAPIRSDRTAAPEIPAEVPRAVNGSVLGRPVVDRIHSSRDQSMKELRAASRRCRFPSRPAVNAVTMPKVAERLGVGTMSLYRHVRVPRTSKRGTSSTAWTRRSTHNSTLCAEH